MEWISIKDRLPEGNQNDVLVFGGVVGVGVSMDVADFKDGTGDYPRGFYRICDDGYNIMEYALFWCQIEPPTNEQIKAAV